MDAIAVAVMNSFLISAMHSSYSGAKIFPSGGTQGPPLSARMRGFTARM